MTPKATPLSTRDAVQDIWGERTPYKHQWPTRVDQHCIEEPESWVQGACVMCSNGCGCDYGVKNGKVVGIRGRASDRVNKGRLGPKGLYAWKTLNHPDRLKYPQIRRNGKLERATWDEAMTLIVERSRDIQSRLTNHGIAFYTTGQFFLEEYYALAMVGKAGLNTLHMDGNTRLCTATAAASMRESFGSDGQPGSYTDIDFTDCIMLVGHNMAATQTVLWSRILDRLAGSDPPTVIVIDPRKSESAKKATIHLAPKIGTNVALLNGLQHLLFENGYVNEEFIANNTVQVDELKATVKDYTPALVSEITGITADDIIRVGHILGKTKMLLSTALQGVYQSNQATAAACQINDINLILGQIGRPGAGIFQMNGQPTAQNNREVGCDGEFPGFRNHENPKHMKELAGLWNIKYEAVPHWNEPTHIENMLKYIKAGTIEMIWISGTNPLVSLPNLPMVRELLTKESLFVVVQDIFPTETSAIADVVLPGAAQGEKIGCFTNVDRTVHLSHKAQEPPGEAKPDFDIFVDYAKRMDFRDKDNNPLLPFTTPSEAFDAWKTLSKGRPCDYSAMSYEKLTGGSGIQWPCTEKYPFGKERLFDDGQFFTDIEYCESYGHDLETGATYTRAQYEALNPAGRAILKPCHYHPEFESVDEEYPLHLSTGRRPLHFHTRTKTGRTKELQEADPESYVQLGEKDAKARGIKEGDWVVVESRRGKVELKARVGLMAEGQVFVPFHFGYFDSHDGKARAANELTQERWDPVSKQPLFKSGAVKVNRVEKQDDGLVHVHEKQTSAVKQVEGQTKKHTQPDGHSGHSELHRFLEYWLAVIFDSFTSLRDICDNLIPTISHADYEVSSGMQIMHRITIGCIERLEEYVRKYDAEGEFGYEASNILKEKLFSPNRIGNLSGSESYDTLVALEGFYTFLSQIDARLLTLNPSAQATWDKGFVSAVDYVQVQVERMRSWTRQQLKSRSSQALLVPCIAAAELRKSLQKDGPPGRERSHATSSGNNGPQDGAKRSAGGDQAHVLDEEEYASLPRAYSKIVE